MLGGSCNPCCGEKWVCQCDCHFSEDEVAYPVSTSVEITQAPVWTTPNNPNQTWTLNKTYSLISPAYQATRISEGAALLAFSDADGGVCCVWNNGIGAFGYGAEQNQSILMRVSSFLPGGRLGTGVEIKGNKLFVLHSYPYIPDGGSSFGPFYAAVARYTSPNLLLNEALCRRQTAGGQTEVTGNAQAVVVYEGPPPAGQPGFTFSWRVLLPQ